MSDPSDLKANIDQKGRDSQDNEKNERIGLRDRLNTYARPGIQGGRGYQYPDEVNTFFTKERLKFERLLENKQSFTDYMQIAAEIKSFDGRMRASEEASAIFVKLNIKISKIREKNFSWTIDYINILYIKTIYEILMPFERWDHFMYIDASPLRNSLLNLDFFLPFFEVPYHSEDDEHLISETIHEFYAILFATFSKLFILFPCGCFPRLDTDQLSLLDPFMRQRIRTSNYRRYARILGNEVGTRLTDTISEIIEKFILEGALKWTASDSDHIILPILQLVHDALSFGLILPTESVRLMENIYMVSEVIIFVEESLKDTKATSMQRRKTSIKGTKNPAASKVYREFLQCRIYISRIVLQLITLYSDAAFVEACFANRQTARLGKKRILEQSVYENESFYKHICLTFLKYLSPRLSISNISNVELSLDKYNIDILLFLTDYRKNVFMDSLLGLSQETTSYYFEPLEKSIKSKIKIVKKKVQEFLQLIKNSPIKIESDILIGRLEEICSEILIFGKEEIGNGFKMELTRNGTLEFLLHTIEQLHVHKENRAFSVIAIDCLIELMKGNHSGQSLFFRGATHDSYLKFFESHKFRCMNMVLEIFRNDYLLFDKSDQVFEMKIQLYDRLLGSFNKYQQAKEDNNRFRLVIGTLRFFNTLFEDILLLSHKNKDWNKKYDVIIQLKLVDIITGFVMPAISDPEFLKDFTVIDLKEVNDFRFSFQNVKNHSEYFKSSSLRVILYELYFTFLKLFVRATTFAFPKTVYDKVVRAIRKTSFGRFYFDFPSGPTLRMWYIKLCTRFFVFPNNQILYETPEEGQYINVHRDFVPHNHAEIRIFLEDEFDWLAKVYESNPEPNETQHEVIKNYIIRGALPAVYKFLQGTKLVITAMEDRQLVEDIQTLTHSFLKMIENKANIINCYLNFKSLGKSIDLMVNSNDGMLTDVNEEDRGRGSQYGENDYLIPSNGAIDRGSLNLLMKGEIKEASGNSDKNTNKPNNYKAFDNGSKLLGQQDLIQSNMIQSRERKPKTDLKVGGLDCQMVKDDWSDEIIEEKLDNNFLKIRRNIRSALLLIEKMYAANPEAVYHIENFMQRSKMRAGIDRVGSEKGLPRFWKNWCLLKRKRVDIEKTISEIIECYQSREFELNPYKNVLMRLLTLDDHCMRLNRCLADGCISLIGNLTLGSNGSNYERSFFLNERYALYLKSINTIMSYSPNLRIQLYNLLQDAKAEAVGTIVHAMNYEGIRMDVAFFGSIWSILVNLKIYISFKPFHDKYGAEFIAKYMLVSGFLQNFFRNNFVKFKTFMNEKGYGILNLHELHLDEKTMQPKKTKHVTFEVKEESQSDSKNSIKEVNNVDQVSGSRNEDVPLIKKKDTKLKPANKQNRESIFFENFLLMKEFFKKCNVSKNESRKIAPSDREHLFLVLIQAMNIVTEFVSGPCLTNQLRIYNQYMFLWNGIIGRIVEDVDSSFYLVKGAVLLYIQGLLQGLNNKIVDFVSKELEIQTLYETIIESLKLLYFKFRRIKKEGHPDQAVTSETEGKSKLQNSNTTKYKNYDITNHFESLIRQNKLEQIVHSPASMLELFKYNDEFNSHNVIQIVVTSYILMKTLGDKIKLWYLYLAEKEKMAKKWRGQKEGQEKHIIFRFLLKIMFSVEIVYEIIQNDEKTVNNKHGLQLEKKSGNHEGKPMWSDYIPKESITRMATSTKRNKTSEFKISNRGLQSTEKLISHGKISQFSYTSNAIDQTDIRSWKLKVQRRFFYLRPPSCFFFTNYTKDQFLEGLPTEHTASKQLYLYGKLKHVQREVESYRLMSMKYGIFSKLVTGDAFKIYEIFVVLLSIGLIILMMVIYENPSQTPGEIVTYNQAGNDAISIYVYIFVAISGLILVAWLLFRWRIETILAKEKKKTLKPEGLTKFDLFKIRFIDGLVLNSTFSSYLINFVITILGLLVYPGIYTLNLFLMVKVFKPLTDIARALTDNITKLLVTFILLLLMVYLSSFVVLVALPDRVLEEVLGPQNCRDLITCFMNVLNLGIRAPGGIGEILALISDTVKQRFWTMWFLNMFFLFVIKLVVLDIVAGIVIETFGELRDERNEREYDESNYCMICGMDRWESEKRFMLFEEHIEKTHNKWNYFYFLIRLLSLPKDKLVGFEWDIINQFQRGQTRWFPNRKFLSQESGYLELKNENEENSDTSSDESSHGQDSDNDSQHSQKI